MSPAWIRKRPVKAGRGVSYQVCWRFGGAGSGTGQETVKSGGTFRTEREAKARRDLVAGWVAQGLDPRIELAKLRVTDPPARRSREQWRDHWLASRHDIDPSSERTYRAGVSAVYRVLPPDLDLADVSVTDCLDAVAKLADRYQPTTVSNYWQSFEQLLDYLDRDPNPARDRKVRLPRIRRATIYPPTSAHVEVMLRRLAGKYLLPFALLETTAVRVETIDAATWDNVDVAGSRLRVTEKGRKVRFVPVPAWLVQHIAATCPPEDRTASRRLFPDVTSTGLRTAMRNACQAAGIPHYHPHDLRHRRASLWHLQAIPDAVLAERLGHEKASFSKDMYAHVMPDVEVPQETWERVLVMTP